MATATTKSVCSLTRLEKMMAIRMLVDEPSFSQTFLQYLLARSIRIEADLIDQLFNSSEKRLARALLRLANFGKEGQRLTVIVKPSEESLAKIVGTTPTRVNFFMNKFRKMGFISHSDRLEVHSSLLNVVLHDNAAAESRTRLRQRPSAGL